MGDQLGTAAQCFIRNTIHISHNHVGTVPKPEERIGSAIYPDQDWLCFAMYADRISKSSYSPVPTTTTTAAQP